MCLLNARGVLSARFLFRKNVGGENKVKQDWIIRYKLNPSALVVKLLLVVYLITSNCNTTVHAERGPDTVGTGNIRHIHGGASSVWNPNSTGRWSGTSRFTADSTAAEMMLWDLFGREPNVNYPWGVGGNPSSLVDVIRHWEYHVYASAPSYLELLFRFTTTGREYWLIMPGGSSFIDSNTLTYRANNTYTTGFQSGILARSGAFWPVPPTAADMRGSAMWIVSGRGARYEGPVVTSDSVAYRFVGDPVVDGDGVHGRWYFTPSKTIPDAGSITLLRRRPVPDEGLLHVGGTYVGVGRLVERYEMIDGERLSGIHPEDTTSTIFERDVYIRTREAPALELMYGPSAVDPGGTSIHNSSYDVTAFSLPCGGEEGWTRQQLRGEVSANGIAGTYMTVIHMGSNRATQNTGGTASLNYNTNTAVADKDQGTLVRGVLAARNSYLIELSESVTGAVKIDRQNPVANVTYHGGMNFTDASTDALSGISQGNPTKIALVVGTATPSDSDYYALGTHPTVANGNYRLWVWATDKAGNEHKVRRSNSLYISGEVSITKDTDKGATLHVPVCVNASSIYVETDCGADCVLGAQKDILGDTPLTYRLVLSNSDSTTQATGAFIDYVPSGCIVSVLPSWTVTGGSGSVTNLSFDLGGVGSGYEGQYRVMGDYTLGGASSIVIDIAVSTAPYDTAVAANNLLSNQASLTWTMGALNGSNQSNFANHRIYIKPYISKSGNWGAAKHVEGCNHARSLKNGDSCATACVAGDTGYVQKGDYITYKLSFVNPSHYAVKFTNTASQPIDTLPNGVEAIEWNYGFGSIDGSETLGGPIPLNNTVMHTHSQSVLENARLESGHFGVSSMIVEPNGYINIYIKAKVTGTYDEMIDGNNYLVNRIDSEVAFYDPIQNVNITPYEEVPSNYITHKIEVGTLLEKWAYSSVAGANNPTLHKQGCIHFDSIFVSGGCIGCVQGSARLQDGNIVTYSLMMNNSQNLHKGSALAGNILTGGAIPGDYVEQHHTDIVPTGMSVDPESLRIYVTDKLGNNIPINTGSIFSTPQVVNERGGNVTREVLEVGSLPIGVLDIRTGTGEKAFQLSNVNLLLVGTQWEFEIEQIQYHREGGNDTLGYSITYLFDAIVDGAYDANIPTNNYWMNQWKQENANRRNDPEILTLSSPEQFVILSNSVVHARITEGVDTLFTKVGADDLTLGLNGAEFALYKWDGTNPPTTAQANHMVDKALINDTTHMPAGQWVRVKENAEPGTLSDLFVSDTTPQGEVNLGKLPTGTYTLIETKAPTGYHLPVGQWILTIDSDKTDTAADDWKIEIVGKSNSIAPPAAIRDESVPNAPTYKIVNAEPFLIGLSGLGGTTGMLLTGFVLMAIAGNTYLVCRYKRNQKQETKDFSE